MFTKILNYTNFHEQFLLSQNVSIFPLYILLTRRIDTFWCEGITAFWSVGIRTVWYRKSQTKNQQYSQMFELCRSFMHNFLCQTFQKTTLLTDPILCHYLAQLSSDLDLTPTLTQLIVLAIIQLYEHIQTIQKSAKMCQY